jgi:cytochrome P450/NADPH-dependent 2,4-dienoyl-CoA reductase/sulfur reductase-like enzyme
MRSNGHRPALQAGDRIVIVGASLAGLSAAETLRGAGFTGPLTLIGEEPCLPYDRPPLSKAVLAGQVPAEHTQLPRRQTLTGVDWRLGVAATGLDLVDTQVILADGSAIAYDRLLIATGTRARSWFNEAEAHLEGVFTIRGREDAARLRTRLAAKPQRVLIIGGGFTGCEVASVCRELGLPVTLVERGTAPLVSALGGTVAGGIARLQHEHGVDLHCQVTVTSLEGDEQGRLRRAHLSDGRTLEADVAVVALGAIRNTEWLQGSGLAVTRFGVACDAGCRAIDINALVLDDVFVAGDIARFPHPLYNYQFLALEHWGNAVQQARVAAHNMVCAPAERRPHVSVPAFWSSQFGVNIKSVGVPTGADEVAITQGSPDEARCVVAYGKDGRMVAAVAFNQARWLEAYQRLIEQSAPFPPQMRGVDQPASTAPLPAAFPDPRVPTHEATVILTGYDPNEQRVQWIARQHAAGKPHTPYPCKGDHIMPQDTTILRQIFDYTNRANPYPLWARLRQTPVGFQEDGPEEKGTYVVSTYREIMTLLHDPRISSDFRNSTQTGGRTRAPNAPYTFISLDPPEHDRLRRLAMRHFGPPERPAYLEQLRPEIERIVTTLLDQLQGQRQIDLVDNFAYPLPVTVICRILGVPLEDEPQFHQWAKALVESLATPTEEQLRQREQASNALHQYMAELVERRRKQPGDDLLSRMTTDTGPEGRMADPFLVSTAVLLLIAGHETTVNLIDNGMLTLLRHPAMLERLRRAPHLIPAAVEEMLRYEPPVQLLPNRTTLDAIALAGATIPRGVVVTLALAAGNRDPERFPDPDRFDPERRDNAHLGFGSGIHSCFGAPLARMEAQIAFTELVRRLSQPRLVVDPPPYRPSPLLRGPEHLVIEVEGVRASGEPLAHAAQR